MSIFDDLRKVGLTSESSSLLFHVGTRDNPHLRVYRDSISGVIFIKDFYVGDSEYVSGDYRYNSKSLDSTSTSSVDYERLVDCDRRSTCFRSFYAGKKVLDFGCGYGDFLLSASNIASSVVGIELQETCIKHLRAHNISCYSSLDSLPDSTFDSAFLFHSFEHLENPLAVLSDLRNKLASSGKIVIEVPHANDFLISHLKLDSFIDFTLWSQHLILHTRESLRLFLEYAGFKNILVKGIQRYSISNHLQWVLNNRPGGHRSSVSILESESLVDSYSAALSAADMNDTLVAVADAS